MFRSLQGCLGFIYAVDGAEWTTTTFWSSRRDIEEAGRSEDYRQTVADIVAAGYLRGEQSTTVYDVEHWEPPV